jgi:hypothetical protein
MLKPNPSSKKYGRKPKDQNKCAGGYETALYGHQLCGCNNNTIQAINNNPVKLIALDYLAKSYHTL